jgi:hypothetical protein
MSVSVSETLVQRLFDLNVRYQERWQVLDYLLHSEYNGYTWKDGEIIDSSDRYIQKDVILGDNGKAVQRMVREYLKPEKIVFYKPTDKSLINQIPADLHPDWKEVIREFNEFKLNNKIEYTEEKEKLPLLDEDFKLLTQNMSDSFRKKIQDIWNNC